MVGFLMYEPRGNEVVSLHRFMIDAKFQGQGMGRQAMELALEEIFLEGMKTIYLSFRPENVAARNLYESLGFIYELTEPDGEIVYRFGPKRTIAS
jgi:diamine N-acetyltransferase